MVITVTTGDNKECKLDLSTCTTWVERCPRKTRTWYLHRTPKGHWVQERRFTKAPYLNYAYVIQAWQAVNWLIQQDQVIPDDCSTFDRRVDLDEKLGESDEEVTNYCIHCTKHDIRLENSPTEMAILDVLGDDPLSGREIANLADRPYNSHFRALLARLVASQVIQKVKGRAGYRLRPAKS